MKYWSTANKYRVVIKSSKWDFEGVMGFYYTDNTHDEGKDITEEGKITIEMEAFKYNKPMT